MSDFDASLAASRWDDEYRAGRYRDEPPLPFVAGILAALRADPDIAHGRGLYVGCGNGRNFLPLTDAGLDLYGIDISPEAIRQLTERRPALGERLRCTDLRDFEADRPFAYLIAIQVFQHGDEGDVASYFSQVGRLLQPGGLFCLRVNSAATQINYAHTLLDRNRFGGFTIRYADGPKRGLPIHFYSAEELRALLQDEFEEVWGPREDVQVRIPPQTGTWAQWEGIWRRL